MMITRGSMDKTERQRRDRSRRVALLIVGIVLLSLGDLLITLTYLRSTGMAEANPIAAWLIRVTGSATVLTAYKALTVGVCISLLYRLRRHVEGEVGAWCAVTILALTVLVWYDYSGHFDAAELAFAPRPSVGEGLWLFLD